MFGFLKRRAQARAAETHALEAERARRRAEIDAAVHTKLTAEIAGILDEAVGTAGANVAEADRLTSVAEALQKGVDAVLMGGADAYGPDLAGADRPTQAGAMLAHGTRNITIVTRTLDHPDSRGDIRHILGLPRDT